MPDTVVDAVCIGETMAVLVPEQPGPLERAEVFRRGVGGAESNVACGLAALGVSTAWISRVGADGFGRLIITQLAERGVESSGVAVDPHRPTGLYVKEIGRSADSAFDLGPGSSKLHYYRSDSAASALDPKSLDEPRAAALLNEARLVHLTGITAALGYRAGRDGGRRLVEAVLDRRRPGQLVSFDLNWRPGLWTRLGSDLDHKPAAILAELANRADVVLLGADEAEAVFGTDDPQRLRALLPGPRVLVVKDSGHHVTAFDDEGVVTEPALAVDVVEPIGAGDAFAAGYLTGLLRGYDQRRRLRLGHVCAASVLMVDGDHCSPPSPDLLSALLDSSASQWSAVRAARGIFAGAAP
ncbi:sugar kinase [Actinospica sp.]|uniref:sugar kinase n=1 Tax=Actinospica sp. TaxID=1872142 RepID=UPI002C8D6747|nr:sugar kinase [Actinospica sp.]HWG23897.1 sugar kinase [Actinospica sp.]